MLITLHFQLPQDPKACAPAAERLGELVELIREDKEEQAIDPAFFTGNMTDYPEWLREAFADAKLKQALEKFGGCEAGELAEYDVETWYEDLFAGETWDIKLDAGEARPGAARALTYFVEAEPYGGDVPLAWMLLASGGSRLKRSQSDSE
ncbi:MAG: hypothetical protein KIS92_20185 [Planctomycetota bacterium]|nr:hypothetical protein [Planctomycetota bacterium]